MIQGTVRLDDFLREEIRPLLPVGDDLQYGSVAHPPVHGLPQRPHLTKDNDLSQPSLQSFIANLKVRVDLVSQITAAAPPVHQPDVVRSPEIVRYLIQEEG